MAAQLIGKVKAGRTLKIYEVKWDPNDRSVYVSYAGWTKAGNAASASRQ